MEQASEQRQKQWDTIRSMSMVGFALRFGVVIWGSVTALLYLLVMTATSGGQLDFAEAVPVALLVFPALGFAFGVVLWLLLVRPNRDRH